MKVQQLRYLCAIVDCDYVINRAAKALNTSQPGISKQIRLLEDELQTSILRRTNTRILGLTLEGHQIADLSRRILADVDSISSIGKRKMPARSPGLRIVTTQVHAGYLLPPLLEAYHARYPNVTLSLMHGNPDSTCAMIASGKAHVGIVSTPPGDSWNLVQLPCYSVDRALVFLPDHPIGKLTRPLLKDLARYPIVTYGAGFAGGKVVRDVFDRAGIQVNIAIDAIDIDSIKKYVRSGLGIGIMPGVAVDPAVDRLKSISVSHLFGPVTGTIVTNPDIKIPNYMQHLIDVMHDNYRECSASVASAA